MGASCSSDSAHNWEHNLHLVSLSILVLMGVHILATMCVYQFMFFKNLFYVADFVIIGAALIMESIPQFQMGALVQCLLAWRILRIAHGIFLAYEMHHHFAHQSQNDDDDEVDYEVE
eukprot:SAG31_NODE_17990_length_650_cov_1.656987_1_plen_117_part_10